jgi:lactoylglutathione lyase
VRGVIHFGMWVDSVEDTAARVVAAGGTYLTGRHEKDPNVFYEVKYRMPDGTVFDITENGWKGAVKDVAPAAQTADPQS